jgi:hypothetical protein
MSSRLWRVVLSGLAGVLLVVGLVAQTPRASAAADQQCFPETTKCVGPLFLIYWQTHGGLAINGYPVSDERVEVLENGQPYTVQYFERVRMEYHPENAAPNTVLLGQFGRALHPADPPVPPPAGPITQDGFYFEQTGHYVPGTFFGYWNANGGLAQFGYPLSEVISEKLEDGNTYQVQYFERARFELHPENQPPYNVLLGQFGRRVLDSAASKVVPPCQSANLVADVVMMGAAGSREGNVQLINTTDAPCALSGAPKMELLDQNGTPLQVQFQEEPSISGVSVAAAGRGQAIAVPVRWSNYCGANPGTVTIELALPDGGVARAAGASVPPCLGAGQPSTFGYRPFTSGGQDQAAANVVLGYFGAINAKDYQAAYAAFGAALQSQQSYNDFAAGFATTAHVQVSRIVIGGSVKPGTYTIGLTIAATQTDGMVKNFSGTYDVAPENGALKIVAASVAAQ